MRVLASILAAAALCSACGFRKVSSTNACYAYVVTSDSHTCARKTDSTLWCWGNNQYGQLGTGPDPSPSPSPVQVADLAGNVGRIYLPTSIAASSSRTAFTCARRSDSSLWCWGNNEFGQLGTGDTGQRSQPTRAAPEVLGTAIHAVSSGPGFACAHQTDNTVWCWGNNQYGQLGTGGTAQSLVPVQVDPAGLAGSVTQIFAGGSHVCALKAEGTLWCWGNNQQGQLGTGDTRPSSSPVQVTALANQVTLVFAGAEHTCATKADSTLWCWGSDQYGQLGVGDTRGRSSPTQVDFQDLAPGITMVSAAARHTCAVKTDGTLWCWGNNQQGQLGTGTRDPSAVPIQVDSSQIGNAVVQVYAGGAHTCARTTDSALWCWGSNEYGQLGIPSAPSSLAPVRIAPPCP